MADRARDAIKPWDSDHTALVHVLWAAQRDGLTVERADELAAHIMRSTWCRAVRQHAVEAEATPPAREAEKPCETCDGTGAEAVTVLACCGNYRRTGECCGRPVPAQDVDPCPSCGGSGRTETKP